jgi:hypothetical protein
MRPARAGRNPGRRLRPGCGQGKSAKQSACAAR